MEQETKTTKKDIISSQDSTNEKAKHTNRNLGHIEQDMMKTTEKDHEKRCKQREKEPNSILQKKKQNRTINNKNVN